MTTALASLLSGRPVKHTVGMTGEVTLQGRVLPIGGLKQKVLAAHAAGLTEVILPERNRGDLDEVPEEVREQMAFHPVMSIDEVLELALEPAETGCRCRPGVVAARRSRRELRAAAALLERRWTLATIYACSSGAARFNEFRQSLPGVSPTTLSERLEQLEAAGIVERAPRPRPPPPHRVRPHRTGQVARPGRDRPAQPSGPIADQFRRCRLARFDFLPQAALTLTVFRAGLAVLAGVVDVRPSPCPRRGSGC